MERKMFFNAGPQTFGYAKNLRARMTKAELLLWHQIKNNKLGVKFRRQHPMLIYILDFYCHSLKLAIEIDGPIHKFNFERDTLRTDNIEKAGVKVIRFSNNEIINDLERVLTQIREIKDQLMSR